MCKITSVKKYMYAFLTLLMKKKSNFIWRKVHFYKVRVYFKFWTNLIFVLIHNKCNYVSMKIDTFEFIFYGKIIKNKIVDYTEMYRFAHLT